jgi:hypothetical protein
MMRIFLRPLLLSLLCIFAQFSHAAGAISQGLAEEISYSSGVATSTTGSLTTAATGSTFLIVFRDYSPATTTVTDTKSNSYTQIGSTVTIGSTALSAWLCVNCTGGSGHKPTVTKSSGDLGVVSFSEITGTATASATDGTAGAGLDTSSPFDATVTTTNANDLIVGIGSGDGFTTTITYTPGAGFTLITAPSNSSGTNALSLGVMTRNPGATGTYGPNFTVSSGPNAGVITFALKELAGGGTVVNPLTNKGGAAASPITLQ